MQFIKEPSAPTSCTWYLCVLYHFFINRDLASHVSNKVIICYCSGHGFITSTDHYIWWIQMDSAPLWPVHVNSVKGFIYQHKTLLMRLPHSALRDTLQTSAVCGAGSLFNHRLVDAVPTQAGLVDAPLMADDHLWGNQNAIHNSWWWLNW